MNRTELNSEPSTEVKCPRCPKWLPVTINPAVALSEHLEVDHHLAEPYLPYLARAVVDACSRPQIRTVQL